MNKYVIAIATATGFLLTSGMVAQATIKNTSVKFSKVSSKRTYIKGVATKSAAIRISRYNITYAYGKATKKGRFNLKLKHKLHKGRHYRVTVSRKGYKTYTVHVKFVKNNTGYLFRKTKTTKSDGSSSKPTSNKAIISEPNKSKTDADQSILKAGSKQEKTDNAQNTISKSDMDPYDSNYPSWLEKKNRDMYDRYQSEIKTNDLKLQADSTLIKDLTNQRPQAEQEYNDYKASIQEDVTAHNGGYTNDEIGRLYDYNHAVIDIDQHIKDLTKDISDIKIQTWYLKAHLNGLNPNSPMYGY